MRNIIGNKVNKMNFIINLLLLYETHYETKQ